MAVVYFFAGVLATVLTAFALGGLSIEYTWDKHDRCPKCGYEHDKSETKVHRK